MLRFILCPCAEHPSGKRPALRVLQRQFAHCYFSQERMPLLCGAVVHLFRGIFLLRRKIFVPLVIIDRGPGLVSCCPWVHIAIANAKLLLLDVYHDIRPEYLQNYLNEFCWKFNRRNFGEALFDRLMVAAVSYKNQFMYNIE